MSQPFTQSIPNTRIPAGDSTIPLPATTQVFKTADVVLSRTVTGGLNSLTTADTLSVWFDYSLDGGTSWLNVYSNTFHGGTIIFAKDGSTDSQVDFAIGRGDPFPVGTGFQLRMNATAAVRVSGTVTYS